MPERGEFRMVGQHRFSGVVATAVALVAVGGCSSSPSGEGKPDASQRPRTAVGDDAPSGCTGTFTLKGGSGATTADVEAGKPLTLRLDCIDQVVVNNRFPSKFTGTMTAAVSDGTAGPAGTPLRKIVWSHGQTDYLDQSRR